MPTGATYATKDEDFVASPDIDFHPTDVIEDADGGLIVVDTGGWYKLCCPTSQLHKPDVLGAIYRVTRRGVPYAGDSRRLKALVADAGSPNTPAGVERVVALLGDRRPAVRKLATQALAANAGSGLVLEAIRKAAASELAPRWRNSAVWTAVRIDRPQARDQVRAFLSSADETVRQAAIHATSIWRDREALPLLVRLLDSSSLYNRRAAAEALGRIGDPAAVPALLLAAGRNPDRLISHSVTYALIEIADPGRTAAGLSSSNPPTVRAAHGRARPDELGPARSPVRRRPACLSRRRAQGDRVVDHWPAPRMGWSIGRCARRSAQSRSSDGSRAHRARAPTGAAFRGRSDPGAAGIAPCRGRRPLGGATVGAAGHGLLGAQGRRPAEAVDQGARNRSR